MATNKTLHFSYPMFLILAIKFQLLTDYSILGILTAKIVHLLQILFVQNVVEIVLDKHNRARFTDWRGTNSRRMQKAIGGLGVGPPEKFSRHAFFSFGNMYFKQASCN